MSIRFSLILCVSLMSLIQIGCFSIPHSTPNNSNDGNDSSALCAQLNQALSSGPIQNATYSNQPITSADEARLLKQYDQYGCASSSPHS